MDKSLLKSIRLVALDLDGTVLTDDKKVTARTARAIKEAIERGIEVAVVTGRPAPGIPDEVLAIPGLRYAISSNGSVVTNLITKKIVWKALLDKKTSLDIAKICVERDCFASFFIGGYGYSEEESFYKRLNTHIGTPLEAYVRRIGRCTDDILSCIEKSPVDVENIWIRSDSTAERDAITALITEGRDVKTFFTAPEDVEVVANGADKGIALMGLAAHLGIERANVLAMGDNANDLAMLRAAGVSVAMGNAFEEVKKASMMVTASNEEDGVALILENI